MSLSEPFAVQGTFDKSVFKPSVKVWIERPNVCFKLVSCCAVVSHDKLHALRNSLPQETLQFASSILSKLKGSSPYHIDQCISAQVRRMVPKRLEIYDVYHELILEFHDAFLFIPLCSDTLVPYNHSSSYFIQCCKANLKNNEQAVQIRLYLSFDSSNTDQTDPVVSGKKLCTPNDSWLKETLVRTLLKWCLEKKKTDDNGFALPSSLSCINQEQYTMKYSKLKIQYGKEIAEVNSIILYPSVAL